MSADRTGHINIIATKQEAIQTADGHIVILTEYRGDGCVTWREA